MATVGISYIPGAPREPGNVKETSAPCFSDEYQVGISKAGSPGNRPDRTGEPLVDAHVRHEQSADRELFRARVERGDLHSVRKSAVRDQSLKSILNLLGCKKTIFFFINPRIS